MAYNYSYVQEILSKELPKHLFHYTSPSGCVGIAESQTLWATHIHFLNDSKELWHAADIAKNIIDNLINRSNFKSDDLRLEMLQSMYQMTGSVATGIYIISFSADGDLLSQWRAYCPSDGGYALGFPADKLKNIADKQHYMLAPCIYEHEEHHRLVAEIVNHHWAIFCQKIDSHLGDIKELIKNASWQYARELSKFAPILKHTTFKEEKEWRLISPQIGVGEKNINYRSGRHSMIPYCVFNLRDPSFPYLPNTYEEGMRGEQGMGIRFGPTRDRDTASFVSQSIMRSHFGDFCWHGGSDIPFRSI